MDLNEAQKQKRTLSTFIDYLEENNGFALMDDGKYYYFCKLLNEKNFDFSEYESFLEQLKEEGKYDWYYATGIIDANKKDQKISPSTLPIFGDKNRWVTKWFTRYPEDVVGRDLRDKWMQMKDRIEFFKIPEDEKINVGKVLEDIKALGLNAKAEYSHKHRCESISTNVYFLHEDDFNVVDYGRGYISIAIKDNKFKITNYTTKENKTISSEERLLAYLKNQIKLFNENMSIDTAENILNENGYGMEKKNKIVWYNDAEDLYLVEEFESGENLTYEDKEEGYIGNTAFGIFRGVVDAIGYLGKVDSEYDSQYMEIEGEELDLIDGGIFLFKNEPILRNKKHLREILDKTAIDTKLDDWILIRED